MAAVLLVDDDAAGLELRQLILERHGYTVACASDKAAARRIFAETHPDTIVLDLRLPDAEDGLELIRHFRTQSPQCRIIVLSGWPLDVEGRAEAALVDAVLAKPVHMAKLVEVLKRS